MCIAIVTRADKVLSQDTFEKCWRINSHGFGMAYINRISGDVEIDKGFMNCDGAWRTYQRRAVDMKCADKAMLLHFRLRTVGGHGADNCHPFRVKGGAMIHNGTLFRGNFGEKSDTRVLAEIMHNELNVANLEAHTEQFKEAFGYNRIAFLFKGGKVFTFDGDSSKTKALGHWNDDIWYSNGAWKGAYDRRYPDNIDAFDDATELCDLDRYHNWQNRGPRRFGGRGNME